jgi:Anti-sigma-K factor rskA
VLLWPIGVLTGGDDDSGGTASNNDAQPAAQTTTEQGQPAADGPAGVAVVVDRNGKKQLLVQAAQLAPSGQNEGYYVWLYNSQGDSKSLGGQVTDEQGNYQAIGALPADFQDYRFIDVTRQRIGSDPNIKHSGESVLRGRMPELQQPQGKANQPRPVGQSVLRPPAN